MAINTKAVCLFLPGLEGIPIFCLAFVLQQPLARWVTGQSYAYAGLTCIILGPLVLTHWAGL